MKCRFLFVLLFWASASVQAVVNITAGTHVLDARLLDVAGESVFVINEGSNSEVLIAVEMPASELKKRNGQYARVRLKFNQSTSSYMTRARLVRPPDYQSPFFEPQIYTGTIE
jgi:hypothetical protein